MATTATKKVAAKKPTTAKAATVKTAVTKPAAAKAPVKKAAAKPAAVKKPAAKKAAPAPAPVESAAEQLNDLSSKLTTFQGQQQTIAGLEAVPVETVSRRALLIPPTPENNINANPNRRGGFKVKGDAEKRNLTPNAKFAAKTPGRGGPTRPQNLAPRQPQKPRQGDDVVTLTRAEFNNMRADIIRELNDDLGGVIGRALRAVQTSGNNNGPRARVQRAGDRRRIDEPQASVKAAETTEETADSTGSYKNVIDVLQKNIAMPSPAFFLGGGFAKQ